MNDIDAMLHRRLSRRTLGKTGAAAGAGLMGLSSLAPRIARADDIELSVLSPLPPDPAPPGAAKFSEDAFAKWQQTNGVKVNYELLAWPQLHDRMATDFASGAACLGHLIYMSRLGPGVLSSILTPIADKLSG